MESSCSGVLLRKRCGSGAARGKGAELAQVEPPVRHVRNRVALRVSARRPRPKREVARGPESAASKRAGRSDRFRQGGAGRERRRGGFRGRPQLRAHQRARGAARRPSRGGDVRGGGGAAQAAPRRSASGRGRRGPGRGPGPARRPRATLCGAARPRGGRAGRRRRGGRRRPVRKVPQRQLRHREPARAGRDGPARPAQHEDRRPDRLRRLRRRRLRHPGRQVGRAGGGLPDREGGLRGRRRVRFLLRRPDARRDLPRAPRQAAGLPRPRRAGEDARHP